MPGRCRLQNLTVFTGVKPAHYFPGCRFKQKSKQK